MLRRLAYATLLILALGGEASACSGWQWQANDLVTNEPVSSANGRYTAVVRWHEGVRDFTSERAGKFFSLDHPEPPAPFDDEEPAADPAPPQQTVIAALYENAPRTRRLVAEIPILREHIDQVLVPNSGQYLVATRRLQAGCGHTAGKDDPIITIYRTDHSRTGPLTFGDLLTPYDLQQLAREHLHFGLRRESETLETVIVTIPAPPEGNTPRSAERRVDVHTAKLLDPKDALYPPPRVYVTPAAAPQPDANYEPSPADCAVAWADPNLVRLPSKRFFAEAVFGPLPPFPKIALHARLRSAVTVDVLVSETGDVLCTRPTRYPFGISQLMATTAQRWKFHPLRIDGQPTRYAGELLFHFRDVDDKAWRELMRTAPPTGE